MDEGVYFFWDPNVGSSIAVIIVYWQIGVIKSDKKNTTFTSHHILYQSTCMKYAAMN